MFFNGPFCGFFCRFSCITSYSNSSSVGAFSFATESSPKIPNRTIYYHAFVRYIAIHHHFFVCLAIPLNCLSGWKYDDDEYNDNKYIQAIKYSRFFLLYCNMASCLSLSLCVYFYIIFPLFVWFDMMCMPYVSCALSPDASLVWLWAFLVNMRVHSHSSAFSHSLREMAAHIYSI